MILGFSADDRNEQTRRLAAVAAIGADAGLISIVASVSPFASARAARQVQHWCRTLPRGLLLGATSVVRSKRRRRHLCQSTQWRTEPDVTGVSAPYEAPENADLVIDTSTVDATRPPNRSIANLGF